jgi:RNA polymerase sigma-70 factor (ECF subfamily)
LYSLVYKELYRVAYYSLRNEHDVADVVSETVLDAFGTIKKLRNEDAFRAWIFKILSAKIKRKQAEYAKAPADISEPVYENMLTEGFEFGNVELAQAMSSVEETDRLILSMSVLCGYTGDEIASVCGIKPSTVRSRLMRTKEKLRKYIKEGDNNE